MYLLREVEIGQVSEAFHKVEVSRWILIPIANWSCPFRKQENLQDNTYPHHLNPYKLTMVDDIASHWKGE